MKKIHPISLIHFLLLLVLCIPIIYALGQPHSDNGFNIGNYTVVDAVERMDEDGDYSPVAIPFLTYFHRGQSVRLQYEIKQKSAEDFLFLYAPGLDVDVYLNDRLLESYDGARGYASGRDKPAKWLIIPLRGLGDGSGQLTVVYTATEKSGYWYLERFYIGTQASIIMHLIWKNILLIIGVFMLLVIGVTFQIYYLVVLRKTEFTEYRYLGLFMFFVALQICTCMPIRQLFVYNLLYADQMDIMFHVMTLLMLWFFMADASDSQRRRNYRLVHLYLLFLIIHMVLLHVFHNNQYMIIYVAGCLIVSLGFLRSFVQVVLMQSQEHDEAIQENNERTAFLADVSHAIRTPTNTILGTDAMILRKATESKTLEYAGDIKNAVNSLLSITDDILDISKLESGTMEIHGAPYNLGSLINDCYNMVILRAQARKLELRVSNDIAIPSGLYGDEVRIRQVIVNILTNAVKYTREGYIEFSIGFERVDQDNILLKIKVKDTGIGIKPENMGLLFQTYERFDENKNRGIEGTGLGLSICKSLVELMGGDISAYSEYGKGSVFSVSIPQKVVDDTPIGSYSANLRKIRAAVAENPLWFQAPDAKVLIVDDVEMNLKVMEELLKEAGIQVDTASSGHIALQKAAEKRYDLIFMDHMMPEMDGIETFHRLRSMELSASAYSPVVMLTANAVNGAKEKYLEEGFVAYLSKPVDEQSLIETCRKYLDPFLIEEVLPEKENVLSRNTEDTEQKKIDALASILNTEEGMNYCMQKKDFYLELLHDFTVTKRINQLQKNLQEEDIDNYRINAHSLKSMARTIGADALSEDAKELEFAAKAQDLSVIRQHHDAFIMHYHILVEQILAALGEDGEPKEDAPKNRLTTDEIRNILREISDAAQSFDMDATAAGVSKLKESELPDSIQEKMQELINANDELEFDDVASLAEIMWNQLMETV